MLHHTWIVPQEIHKGPVFAAPNKLPNPPSRQGLIEMHAATANNVPPTHIVARLAQRIREARRMGFQVRQEYLSGNPGNWCEIAGRKTVFLDASQAAVDQLSVLNDAIKSYRPAA